MKRGLLIAGALTLGVGCSAATERYGAYSHECVDHTDTYNMREGDKVFVGVNDMSFYSKSGKHETDVLKITKLGDYLTFKGNSDGTSIHIGGTEAKLSSAFKLTLTGDEQTGSLEEEGSIVGLSAVLTDEKVAIVSLSWVCTSAAKG